MQRRMDQASEELILFGRATQQAGLIRSTAGNASLRLDGKRMLITAAGTALGDLVPAGLSVVRLDDGRLLEGPRPSRETELHRAVYVARPTARAVLHFQSPAATVLACQPDPPADLDVIPEVPAYVRAHAYVRYAAPGSAELAAAVAAALGDPEVTLVQLGNHGQLVLGATPDDVVRRATFFELAAWMVLQRPGLLRIPPAEVQALRGYSRDA